MDRASRLLEVVAWCDLAEEWINTAPMTKQNHQFAGLLMQTVRRIRVLAQELEERRDDGAGR